MTLSDSVLEIFVRGYHRVLWVTLLALHCPPSEGVFLNVEPDPRAVTPWELVGSAWLCHLCHSLPARWMKPVQLPGPVLGNLCPRFPTTLQTICLNLSGLSPSWTGKPRARQLIPVKPHQLKQRRLLTLFFFFFFLFALTSFLVSHNISFVVFTQRGHHWLL